MARAKRKHRPILFVSIGAPGSGKSYFASRFCKEFGMVHLRSDEIREYIFPKPTYSPEENARLFGLIDFLAEKFIAAGTSVFYDANFTKKVYREKMRRVAKKYNANYAVIWVQTPLSLAVKRAQKRSYHPVGESVVKGIHAETELPSKEPTVVIDGTMPYKFQKLKFIQHFSKSI